MIIMGIDPGLAITGFGLVHFEQNHFQVIQYGVIRTESKQPLPDRLLQIHQGIQTLIKQYKPEAVAVEELFFNTNAKSALLVGQARGVVVVTAAAASLPVYEYTPLQVKQGIAGYGRAEKKQVQHMTKTLLNLKEIPRPDDAADALAIAVCHAHTGHFKQLFSV
ncbi:crossover junction endodeoxyribonuclease RuvC [Anoxynatronum buryatiense]|uniref:Crossover junction endodeoxyribonuclease RuvC n=1 Tax=Anoxynatronum buryatiense TaxID=489973 RepID=A0AA45WUW7_9CLOT|nr:crossover junction endodeoxyribonuclease RuvC [Anoxynatronum buryatiense]SMP49491.1 Holliday junction endonuclease RuvC [Anoxynatronum buryatiense]